MLRKIFFGLLIFAYVYADGQSILNFDRIGIDQGLSSSIVTKIIQDKEGYIWMATSDGLNRYNGYYFQAYNYRQGDSTSLSGNLIYDIIEDRSGTIWVATSNGLSRFNRLENSFTQFRHSADASSLSN